MGLIEAYDGRPRPSLFEVCHTDRREHLTYEMSHLSLCQLEWLPARGSPMLDFPTRRDTPEQSSFCRVANAHTTNHIAKLVITRAVVPTGLQATPSFADTH